MRLLVLSLFLTSCTPVDMWVSERLNGLPAHPVYVKGFGWVEVDDKPAPPQSDWSGDCQVSDSAPESLKPFYDPDLTRKLNER